MHTNLSAPIEIEFMPGIEITRQPMAEASFRGLPRISARTDIQSSDGHVCAEIPADQIVYDRRAKSGSWRIGLGGMSFEGLESEKLVFWRVRELLPSDHVGTGAADKVLISTSLVSSLRVDGKPIWPVRE